MKQKLFLSALFILFSFTAMAQQRYTEEKSGWWPSLEGGYFRQGDQRRIETGYNHHRAKRWKIKKDSTGEQTASLYWGPSAGLIGFVNDKNTFRLGQQLGFSVVYNNVKGTIPYGFKTGISIENYTKKDQRISLAGGLLLLGIVHCVYGYSIPLSKQTIPGIGRHRLGVVIYLNSIGVVEGLEHLPMM